MLPLLPFVCLAYFVLYAFAYSVPASPAFRQQPLGGQVPHGSSKVAIGFQRQPSLDEWLRTEKQTAVQKLVANIAPGGANAKDAAPGTVLASPSRDHPDYYYQWVRDAAITMSTVVSFYSSNPTSNLSSILEAYASLSHRIQHTSNPSGSFADLSGLGEPKFQVDGTPFTGNWGRPQRDGPALRAITLMAYMRAYNASHPETWSSEGNGKEEFADLYQASMPANSTIKADLEYVSHFWREDGFDLWEEIQGLHFFTAMVQARALREGAQLAGAFGDTGASEWYAEQAKEMDTFMDRFWDEEKGHLVETLGGSRSGLDCGLLLGSLHGSGDAPDAKFAPYSDEVLLSLLYLVRDQRDRFPINAAPSSPSDSDYERDELAGVGVGRYPEDEYDGYGSHTAGGNPWFLCTSSVAEVLYRTALHIASTGTLVVSGRGRPFWQALLPQHLAALQPCTNESPCIFGSDAELRDAAVERLQEKADSFLAVVKTHTDGEGSLSEQFDRATGYMRGATDLTWSYGAFLQAVWARGLLSGKDD